MSSKVLGVVVLALAAVALGCSADDGVASEGAEALTKDPLRPIASCEVFAGYVGDLDFRDRAHPRYRIRHKDPSREREVGKQNLQLMFAKTRGDKIDRWDSTDTLVSVYSPMSTRAQREESDRTVPWRDLELPPELAGKLDILAGFEFTFNMPSEVDPRCHVFYDDR